MDKHFISTIHTSNHNTNSNLIKSIQVSDEACTPNSNGIRRPRTSEDFYMFCTYVLQYENYDADKKEVSYTHYYHTTISDSYNRLYSQEVRSAVNQSPPLDSSGSSVNSESTNSDAQQDDKPSGDETDDSDSYDLVTCFCGKPFAGRPMIECSKCFTWIHLTCARIKKSNIPDVS